LKDVDLVMCGIRAAQQLNRNKCHRSDINAFPTYARCSISCESSLTLACEWLQCVRACCLHVTVVRSK